MLCLYIARTSGPLRFWVHPYYTSMDLLLPGILPSALNDTLSIKNSKKKTGVILTEPKGLALT